MAWCPRCKNEYVEGITHCPDCDVDLIDQLVTESEKEESLEIPEDYTFPEDFDPRSVLEPKERPEPARLYKSPQERYADLKSSAWTFLLMGGAGLVIMILGWAGVLRLPLAPFALGVMTALFAAFVGIGIVSFRNAGKLRENIDAENAFTDSVIQWYHTEGQKSPAWNALNTDQPEELLYLQKSELIQQLIKEQFPQIDQALLEKLSDDFCEEDFSAS
ncbi:MAG: hypothetical protein HFI31_11435 [Lachnospiraceae bacterium]|nr:hypothetical protein [Lachnospiraceae bacterium]